MEATGRAPARQGYTVAIRMMLRDDGSASMMLFFGFLGALNAACLAPVLLGLQLAGRVSVLTLSSRVLLLTVCKGARPWEAGPSLGASLLRLKQVSYRESVHFPTHCLWTARLHVASMAASRALSGCTSRQRCHRVLAAMMLEAQLSVHCHAQRARLCRPVRQRAV